MPTKAQTKKKALVYGSKDMVHYWRRLKGLLAKKGPKNPVTWQRRMRQDRPAK